MAVTTTNSKVTYIGDGTTDTFPITFAFTEDSQVKALYRDDALVENDMTNPTDFEIVGTDVVTTSPITNGYKLIIYRDVPYTQTVDWVENDILSSTTLESTIDKLTLLCQQVRETVTRVLIIPISDDTEGTLTLPTQSDRAGCLLYFDEDGLPDVIPYDNPTLNFSIGALELTGNISHTTTAFNIGTSGNANLLQLADAGLTIDGTLSVGNITTSGTVDGVDLSAFKTDYDSKVVSTWGDGLEYSAGTAGVDFNTTNLKITSTELNTIQDIAPASSPSFTGLTVGSVSGMLKRTSGVLGTATADTDYQAVVTWGDGLEYSGGTAGVDYNTTNLKITSTELNTIQDIATTSTPTFASLTLTKTTEQLRLGYNGSNYNTFTVGATGGLTIAATGTNPNITLTPGGTGYTILNGNVGIGTTSPSYKLDILGTTSCSRFVTSASSTSITNGHGPGLYIKNSSATTGNYASISFQDSNEHLLGSIGVKNGDHSANGIGNFFIEPKMVSDPATFVVNYDGNVGIGTNSPSGKLHVNSDTVYLPTAIHWTPISDETAKEEITLADIDRCYEVIKNIPLKRFAYVEGIFGDYVPIDKHKLGWIAQDVETYLPKSISSIETTKMVEGEEVVVETKKALNVDQLEAMLYGAVKKLMDKVEALETTVLELQNA